MDWTAVARSKIKNRTFVNSMRFRDRQNNFNRQSIMGVGNHDTSACEVSGYERSYLFRHARGVSSFHHIWKGCGARGGVVVKALRYKPAGRWFDSRWCHWNFSVT